MDFQAMQDHVWHRIEGDLPPEGQPSNLFTSTTEIKAVRLMMLTAYMLGFKDSKNGMTREQALGVAE